MLKKIVLIIFAAGISFSAWADKGPDTIELTNGKKYTGVILSNNGSQIQFDADGVGLRTYTMYEIKSMNGTARAGLENGSLGHKTTTTTVRHCQR